MPAARRWPSTCSASRRRRHCRRTSRCGAASTASTRAALSGALEARTAVRLLTMRGTIHLLTPDGRATLRPLVQATLDQRRTRQPEQPAGGGRGRPTHWRGRRADGCGRRAAAGQAARRAAGRARSRTSRRPRSRTARASRRTAGAGAAARAVATVRRRGLPDRRAPGSAGRSLEVDLPARPPLPARVRAGHRRRRHHLVGRHRLGPVFAAMADELSSYQCDPDGRDGFDVAGAPHADGDDAGARAAARPLRQRVALARRPRPGHPDAGQAHAVDGQQRRRRHDRLRRRGAGGAVADRRRGRSTSSCSAGSPGRSAPSSTPRSAALETLLSR